MQSTAEAFNDTQNVALRLLNYCRAEDWAGYDPYDVLNSPVLSRLFFLNFRLARVALTQLNKRSPINLRPLLGIKKTRNPKAMALALSAMIRLAKIGLVSDREMTHMVEALLESRSPVARYWCWGYSFPWQTRVVLVPRGAPNLVCTCFVANALLDVFECLPRDEYLAAAISAADYILDELYFAESTVAGFSYPVPGTRSKVHNANLLAAALLCRVHKYCRESRFTEPALKATHYSVGQQHSDGSWFYGEFPTQRWIDNFHTGFNLCALNEIGTYVPTEMFKPALERGLRFYRENFFEVDGAPKYFHDCSYPLDIHSAAQSIITLVRLADLHPDNIRLAKSVYQWTLEHLLDGQGYFYAQRTRRLKIKIPYLRWGQAWMLYAIAELLDRWETPRLSRGSFWSLTTPKAT
jgi:hypothetical protein